MSVKRTVVGTAADREGARGRRAISDPVLAEAASALKLVGVPVELFAEVVDGDGRGGEP
jgi:hypothetical protein